VFRIGLQATAVVASLTLAACGAQPYPTPADEPPPPPPPAADLLGEPAPAPVPPPPPPAAAEYPPVYGPLPAGPDGPPPELAGGPPATPPPAPVIIAMAPIPNPPEPEPARPVRRAYETTPRYAEAEPAPVRPYAPRIERRVEPRAEARPEPRRAPPAPVRPTPAPLQSGSVAPRTPGVAAPRPTPAPALKPAPAVKAPPVKAPAAKAPAVKTPAPKAAAPATPLGDRSARLASLEESLAGFVGRQARIGAPERLTPNQATDVTLTIPAGLADLLREAALKNELSDAASAANVRAMLAGDGYSIAPDQPQSQPLTAGRETQFHWTVIATPQARGPLRADVGLDLLGAGTDTLSLGMVVSGARSTITPRAVGAAILVLIAALVVVWLLRGGRSPAPAYTPPPPRRAPPRRRGEPV
jgi:hypothetical protein